VANNESARTTVTTTVAAGPAQEIGEATQTSMQMARVKWTGTIAEKRPPV
jgi:hypothetical protein